MRSLTRDEARILRVADTDLRVWLSDDERELWEELVDRGLLSFSVSHYESGESWDVFVPTETGRLALVCFDAASAAGVIRG